MAGRLKCCSRLWAEIEENPAIEKDLAEIRQETREIDRTLKQELKEEREELHEELHEKLR